MPWFTKQIMSCLEGKYAPQIGELCSNHRDGPPMRGTHTCSMVLCGCEVGRIGKHHALLHVYEPVQKEGACHQDSNRHDVLQADILH